MKREPKWLKHIYDWSEIIKREGEITEIDLLLKTSTSPWTFNKLKPYLFKLQPTIKYNEKLGLYYFEKLNNSLSTLSPTEKEELK